MKIYFGAEEYNIVPDSIVQETDNKLNFQIIANNIDLTTFEEILSDKTNIMTIETEEEDNHTFFYNYIKLDKLQKKYHVPYTTITKDVIIVPEEIDPVTGDIITNAQHKIVQVPVYADIIFVELSKPELAEQVAENTANIEFIAIMSDIEL